MSVGVRVEARRTDIGLVEDRLVGSRPEQVRSRAAETGIEVGSEAGSSRGQ